MEQKRRASESKANEALALVSNKNFQYNRIPPPLPYLPSDYRPSPDSPRHFLVSNTTVQPHLLFDINQNNKRQRSQSIGHPLAIENSSSSSSSAVTNSQQQQQHFELVPYREWTVIA